MTPRLSLYSLVLTFFLIFDQAEMQWLCKKCAVSSWNPWTPCSQPCGNEGTKTRKRTITKQPTCGNSCPHLTETLPCNLVCPNGSCNCSVSSWSPWSSCTQPCGNGGIQTRARNTSGFACCPTPVETRLCNMGCPNGGTPVLGRDGECFCKIGYSGQCCTQIDGVETIGCYNDTSEHAIPTLEGKDYMLNGNAGSRSDPILKCYKAAKNKGFKVFALQDGGFCSSSDTAENTFNKYGTSLNCKSDGEGGPLANQVYYIKDYKVVGCFRDTEDRAIPTLEGTDPILDGDYLNRQNAIVKCAVAARKRYFRAFALQHGGWCASSVTALETFYKYGPSRDCKEDGEGGDWANNVYVFQRKEESVFLPDPIAFYPLNSMYATREIKDRQPQGTPVGVNLTAGPDGKTGGSYQFAGQANSYIEFPNNGGLDAQRSITMLCWVYSENTNGPMFNYKITGGLASNLWGVHLWIHSGTLYGAFSRRDYILIQPTLIADQPLALNQWHYVGMSYDHYTGIANLWLYGIQVCQKDIGARQTLATQDNVRMGAIEDDSRYFKGRITAMQIYDVALTAEEINAVENAGQEYNSCNEVNWEKALSRPGWANCSLGRYMNGLWRKNDAIISSPDGIDNIKKGRCCIPPHEYKDDTPVCQIVDWKTSLSRKNKWASCPDGHFLQGIYRSNETWLHSIEQALCCRPRNFENITRDCKEQDVRKSLDKKGWSKCPEWNYMMGVYKGDCDKLNCIEMIRCCRMRPQDMVVLGHWMLNGKDKDISLVGSPSFISGRCPGSKAVYFNQNNSFASAPIINLNGRSFTIAFWIKQPKSASDKLGAIYSDWYNPRQFLLSTKNQKIKLQRHQKEYDTTWSLESTNIAMDNWTHVAVTWNHVTGSVLIYADGKIKGNKLHPPGDAFSQPTGWQYQIGEDGHWDKHHFYGSVSDLYVFGTALSLEQINKLRGFPVIVNTTKQVPGGTVVVGWEPPFEETCPILNYTVNYREVLSHKRKSKWHSVTVNGNATSLTLQLSCNTEYDVAVTSLSGYGESALNESKIWNFKTGGDLPSPPAINNKETETLACDVNPTWSSPADNGCPLTMYSIYYRQITEEAWYQVNVTNVTATNYTVSLACGMQYTIEITAWNELGESDRSRPWIIKTKPSSGESDVETSPTKFAKSPAFQSGDVLSSPQLAGLVAGLSVLLMIIFMVVFWLRKKARKNKQLVCQPRRSKSTIIPLWRWEVLPQQVVFEEEIGRGAFGKVLKGTYKESPGIEVFYKTRTETVDFKEGRTVAVKVLGGTADEEARNQLLEEIEIMKAIGSHRNVVSMLGCWVNSDPIFLVLEYVPYGDLQRWLRNKRIQKSYQKNYYNEGNQLPLDVNEVHFNVDDESKALLVRDDIEGKEFVHCDKPAMDCINNVLVDSACRYTLDGGTVTQKNAVKVPKPDVEGIKEPTQVAQDTRHDAVQHEEDFVAKDLLSFAWQIARGMNFLSSNGFVHRDLAARNVLLGDDKVVKISDFGLMRQTHENVYKLKKGKKIPVKWMAPEALYNSEYSTKSDVWSFGILLWELSTMGGNPYPGINNKELYNLLKTGYRMEKPDTCSDKLYRLVLDCWKDEPGERPTFESVTRSLEQMMQEDTPYLDFESLDELKAYYCNEKLSDEDVTV
ncbi:uncharacterized protein LOC144662575 [Oculina patagonica]